MNKVYKDATILIGPDLHIQENAYIEVEGEYIVKVGIGSPSGGVDMEGAVIFPAFVNAHTHIGDVGAKDLAVGLPVEEAVSPPYSVKYRYLQGLKPEVLVQLLTQSIQEMLSLGICAFADFREGGVEGNKCLREAIDQLPIEAVIFSEPTAEPGDWGNYISEIKEIIRVSDGIGMGDVTRLNDCQLATIRQFLDDAGSKKLAVHIAETEAAQQSSRKRWGESEVSRILQFSPDLLIHMTNADEFDINCVAKEKIPVVCCPRTNCILGDGIPPLYDLFQAGISLSLGTDNFMFSSPNMFREMDYFSRLLRGKSRVPEAIDAKTVLSMATLGGARALGIDDRFGSIEEGKVASFIVLDNKTINLRYIHNIYSAIVHRASSHDIKCVIAFGREVYKKEK